MILERGAVHRVRLDPTEGLEQRGMARPCLIIQRNSLRNSGTAIVLPLTSQKPKADFPLTVHLKAGTGGNQIECWARITQIRVVNETRIEATKLAQLNELELESIKNALREILDI